MATSKKATDRKYDRYLRYCCKCNGLFHTVFKRGRVCQKCKDAQPVVRWKRNDS